ncbi:MAG TPA: hypothetical protein VMI12_00110 [Puia sp.]|nr:hypothetical protein [Puia sp.]
MAEIQEILVRAVLPIVKAVGKVEMEHVLWGVKENNSMETYRNTLQGLHSDFSLLKEIALKSKTSIDDGIIDLVLEAVKETAEADGITLA